jgi:hypothetical protein
MHSRMRRAPFWGPFFICPLSRSGFPRSQCSKRRSDAHLKYHMAFVHFGVKRISRIMRRHKNCELYGSGLTQLNGDA